MGLPSNVARLALYTWLLLMWNGLVWTLVFPVTATLGVVIGWMILLGVLNFPSLPLGEGHKLPWWEVMMTNVNIRTPFVVAFVLPASLVFDLFFYLRTLFIQVSATHEEKIISIQNQVNTWRESGSTSKMCTARGGWLTISPKRSTYKNESHRISMELYDILGLDTAAMEVRVEPGVSMGQLSHYLLAKGYTIPVLPEMDDLTVGGLINGCGVEVTSHKYGMFQAICTEFEIILPDGTVRTASASSDPDLFYAIPWSYGSIGFLLSAKIKVIKASKYVRLQYEPTTTETDFVGKFTKAAKSTDPFEFIEGLVYAEHEACLMTGSFADEIGSDGTYNALHKWYKPWFAWHARTFKTTTVEYIPTRAYYHRHTKAIFWELQDMVPAAIGNNLVFRLLLGWLLPPKVAFLKLIQPEAMRLWYENMHVIQDMLVPVTTLAASLGVFRKHYDLYPLWVCPMKLMDVPGFIGPTDDEDMFVDIGAYGIPRAAWKGTFDPRKSGMAVEAFVREVQGFQMLYADVYLDRPAFEDMFDHTLLDKVRARVNANGALPTPFEKTCRRS